MQNLFNVFKIQAEQCWQTWDSVFCKLGASTTTLKKWGFWGWHKRADYHQLSRVTESINGSPTLVDGRGVGN